MKKVILDILAKNKKLEEFNLGSEFHLRIEKEGYMPLVIERHDRHVMVNRADSITEFAIANAVGEKWEIQKYAVPDSVIEKSEFSQLINQSSSANEWVEIQK